MESSTDFSSTLEQEIASVHDKHSGGIILTPTHVIHLQGLSGGIGYTSIPIPQITSMSYRYSAPHFWIFLTISFAVVSVLIWLWLSEYLFGFEIAHAFFSDFPTDTLEIFGFLLPVLSVISLILFLSGRKQQMVIACASTSIEIRQTGSNREAMRQFVRMLEEAQGA